MEWSAYEHEKKVAQEEKLAEEPRSPADHAALVAEAHMENNESIRETQAAATNGTSGKTRAYQRARNSTPTNRKGAPKEPRRARTATTHRR
jgi:hypothetical protein